MVAGSATTDGHAVNQALKRKVTRVGEACRQEGIAFIPMAADTLGGWHTAAVEQVKKLGSALARQRGEDEQLEVRFLFSSRRETLAFWSTAPLKMTPLMLQWMA